MELKLTVQRSPRASQSGRDARVARVKRVFFYLESDFFFLGYVRTRKALRILRRCNFMMIKEIIIKVEVFFLFFMDAYKSVKLHYNYCRVRLLFSKQHYFFLRMIKTQVFFLSLST